MSAVDRSAGGERPADRIAGHRHRRVRDELAATTTAELRTGMNPIVTDNRPRWQRPLWAARWLLLCLLAMAGGCGNESEQVAAAVGEIGPRSLPLLAEGRAGEEERNVGNAHI